MMEPRLTLVTLGVADVARAKAFYTALGFKASGFGGRDNGIHAHDQYTQVKTIWVDLADDAGEAVG